jgi:hypothetical protein
VTNAREETKIEPSTCRVDSPARARIGAKYVPKMCRAIDLARTNELVSDRKDIRACHSPDAVAEA